MRYKNIVLTLMLLFLTSLAFGDEELKKMNGEEWQKLERMDKVDYMMRATDALQMKDVPLAKTTDDYVDQLDSALKEHPEYEIINVSDILEMTVSNNEPAAKEVLDKLKNSPAPESSPQA